MFGLFDAVARPLRILSFTDASLDLQRLGLEELFEVHGSILSRIAASSNSRVICCPGTRCQ